MMVFDDIYHSKKAVISGNIQACLSSMDAEMASRQNASKESMKAILLQQRIMIVATILMIIAAILSLA